MDKGVRNHIEVPKWLIYCNFGSVSFLRVNIKVVTNSPIMVTAIGRSLFVVEISGSGIGENSNQFIIAPAVIAIDDIIIIGVVMLESSSLIVSRGGTIDGLQINIESIRIE